MKDTYCPKCKTHLILSENLENSKLIKCPNCKFSFENPKYFKTPTSETQQKTDPFAVITFASGLGGFVILPILFIPIGYIASTVSYYRLKENKELKGNSLRIIGAILTSINILWLMYQFRFVFFRNTTF